MTFICEQLGDAHDVSGFHSGRETLDDWLRESAHASDARNLTRTYVWHRDDRVAVAYYTLMPYLIERDTLGRKHGRGLIDRIPCYLIARLALQRELQGEGLGSQVLASALTRAAAAADDVGGRLVVVDAIDDIAASFYRHHGFAPVAADPHRLILPIKVVLDHNG